MGTQNSEIRITKFDIKQCIYFINTGSCFIGWFGFKKCVVYHFTIMIDSKLSKYINRRLKYACGHLSCFFENQRQNYAMSLCFL